MPLVNESIVSQTWVPLTYAHFHLSVCFTGRIPTELGQLTALTELALTNNHLTGERG